MTRHVLSFAISLWLVWAGPLIACRYSVRDTGFVDLGAGGYRLELVAGPEFPEAARRAYEQAAAGVLLDANIAFSVTADVRPGEPASLRLVDADGRSLPLTPARTLPTNPAEITRLLESISLSPLREKLFRESLRSYGVVVLIEGSDKGANERVRTMATTAIASIARLIPGMPKPVDVPPQLVAVPIAAQAAEAVALWGLGLDPAPSADPRLAIVYGRGRRLGTPVEGPMITQTLLRERLALIGQDCECDLDRAWLRGPLTPGRWDREFQENAARTLGFDPENPVVRAEVSRIVDRGPEPGQRRRTARTTQALGYSEELVDALPTAVDPADAAENVQSNAVPATITAPPGHDTSSRPLWGSLAAGFGIALAAGGWLVWRANSHR